MYWVRNRKKKKKKRVLGLKARCRWLEASTSKAVIQKNSTQQPHSPGSASIHRAPVGCGRGPQTPRQARRCGQARAQGWIPGYRLLNLPETRKYEPGGFCPQASVLWTKLHLCGLLLSFASTSHIYPTGAFLTFYRRNRTPDVGPVRERDGSAPTPVSLTLQGEGLVQRGGQVAHSRDSKLWGPVVVHLSPQNSTQAVNSPSAKAGIAL